MLGSCPCCWALACQPVRGAENAGRSTSAFMGPIFTPLLPVTSCSFCRPHLICSSLMVVGSLTKGYRTIESTRTLGRGWVTGTTADNRNLIVAAQRTRGDGTERTFSGEWWGATPKYRTVHWRVQQAKPPPSRCTLTAWSPPVADTFGEGLVSSYS